MSRPPTYEVEVLEKSWESPPQNPDRYDIPTFDKLAVELNCCSRTLKRRVGWISRALEWFDPDGTATKHPDEFQIWVIRKVHRNYYRSYRSSHKAMAQELYEYRMKYTPQIFEQCKSQNYETNSDAQTNNLLPSSTNGTNKVA